MGEVQALAFKDVGTSSCRRFQKPLRTIYTPENQVLIRSLEQGRLFKAPRYESSPLGYRFTVVEHMSNIGFCNISPCHKDHIQVI